MVTTMRERPILFKPDLVRAFLLGEKTQTRLIIKPQPTYDMDGFTGLAHNVRGAIWRSGMPTTDLCRYGQPGDRLWVKEQLHILDWSEHGIGACIQYVADKLVRGWTHDEHGVSPEWGKNKVGKNIPSIHMPRWASRLTLEITEVRAQWLHDITEEDAKAEGVKPWEFDPDQPLTSGERAGDSPYRSGFAYKWDCINEAREGGKYLWKNNPAVWALTLKQVIA